MQRYLSSTWGYTAEHGDAREAEIYLREISTAVERVAADPRRDRNRDEIRERYFSYSFVSHVLFYRVSDAVASIEVIRTLRPRIDPARHP